MNTPTPYHAETYWEERLNTHFDCVGVGNCSLSQRQNEAIYRVRRYQLQRALHSAGLSVAGKRVLDIGCGTGFFIDCYRQWGVTDITGLDITQISVDRMRERYPQYAFYKKDITDPAFTGLDGGFDLINCFDVLIHVVEPERFQQALRNIAGLLKPGGLFICSDGLGNADQPWEAHVVFHGLPTYQQAFAASGVRLQGLYPLARWSFGSPPPYSWILACLPGLDEWLDKHLLSVEKSPIRLGLFQKSPS